MLQVGILKSNSASGAQVDAPKCCCQSRLLHVTLYVARQMCESLGNMSQSDTLVGAETVMDTAWETPGQNACPLFAIYQ